MKVIQLVLFADPRDERLERTLHELGQEEWYRDPLHRQEDGGGLWYRLRNQGIDIDLAYCREWMARGHVGWNQVPGFLNCLTCHGETEACTCVWKERFIQAAAQKQAYQAHRIAHPGQPFIIGPGIVPRLLWCRSPEITDEGICRLIQEEFGVILRVELDYFVFDGPGQGWTDEFRLLRSQVESRIMALQGVKRPAETNI